MPHVLPDCSRVITPNEASQENLGQPRVAASIPQDGASGGGRSGYSRRALEATVDDFVLGKAVPRQNQNRTPLEG
jgi:hypothetical protein